MNSELLGIDKLFIRYPAQLRASLVVAFLHVRLLVLLTQIKVPWHPLGFLKVLQDSFRFPQSFLGFIHAQQASQGIVGLKGLQSYFFSIQISSCLMIKSLSVVRYFLQFLVQVLIIPGLTVPGINDKLLISGYPVEISASQCWLAV